MSEPIRILVADDHTLFGDGLRAMFDSLPQTELVGEAATGAEAIIRAREAGMGVPGLLARGRRSVKMGGSAGMPCDRVPTAFSPLFLADEQSISYVLKHFRWHIEHRLDE